MIGGHYHRRYGYPWRWAILAEIAWRLEHLPWRYDGQAFAPLYGRLDHRRQDVGHPLWCSHCQRRPYNPDVWVGTQCGAMLGTGEMCPGTFQSRPRPRPRDISNVETYTPLRVRLAGRLRRRTSAAPSDGDDPSSAARSGEKGSPGNPP